MNAEVSTPYLVPEMRAYRIITRQANTLVRLRSGDMLTIGGLIDKEENKTFRKVPILGDILTGKTFPEQEPIRGGVGNSHHHKSGNTGQMNRFYRKIREIWQYLESMV